METKEARSRLNFQCRQHKENIIAVGSNENEVKSVFSWQHLKNHPSKIFEVICNQVDTCARVKGYLQPYIIKMYLMYYLDEEGKRVYTLKKVDLQGKPTFSAHPARFSPEDKYSRQRLIIKKRFNLLMTQKPEPVY